MEQNEIKGLAVVLFFLDTMCFGCLPYFLVGRGGRGGNRGGNRGGRASHGASLRADRVRDAVISYLNCFAGGVFLGACLLHLMVEGRETLAEYFEESGEEMEFPLYETLVAGGFFFIALIEQLAHRVLRQATPPDPKAPPLDSKAPPPDLEVISDISSDDSPYVPGATRVPKKTITTVSGLNGKAQFGGGVNGVSPAFTRRSPASRTAFTKPGSRTAKVAPVRPARRVTGFRRRGSLGGEAATRGNADLEESGGVFAVMAVRPMRAYLLLGAFSFHTTFDGMAVGLQTDTQEIWQMFAAITIHKSLVALSLGLQLFLVFRHEPRKAVACIFIFSLISPVGLGIGMSVVSSDIDELAKTLSRGVLEGVSTGTFLYVAFFEILHGELGEKKGLLRLLLVVIGFASTAAPKVFHTPHGHEEEESDH